MTLYVLDDYFSGQIAVFSSEQKRAKFFFEYVSALEDVPRCGEDFNVFEIELDKGFEL